ncbi:MAG: hypothetical protein ABIA76_00280, partial [Candidatus Diapherotrites archaeon]
LLNGRRMSPASYFIRTGRIPRGVNPKALREAVSKLGERFLSSTWYRKRELVNSSDKHRGTPLPTQRGRIFGTRLSPKEINQVRGQIDFAVKIFGSRLTPEQRESLKRRIESRFAKTSVSIRSALKPESRDPKKALKHIHNEGKELHGYLSEEGTIYPGIATEKGKMQMRKGFNKVEYSATTPIHETIHALQEMGIIQIDVPFAEAADRVYGLEKGIFKIDKKVGFPTKNELDRRPGLEKDSERKPTQPPEYEEPYWVYSTGKKIGQWVYKFVPEGKRWDYIYERTKGKTHEETLTEIGLAQLILPQQRKAA